MFVIFMTMLFFYIEEAKPRIAYAHLVHYTTQHQYKIEEFCSLYHMKLTAGI